MSIIIGNAHRTLTCQTAVVLLLLLLVQKNTTFSRIGATLVPERIVQQASPSRIDPRTYVPIPLRTRSSLLQITPSPRAFYIHASFSVHTSDDAYMDESENADWSGENSFF